MSNAQYPSSARDFVEFTPEKEQEALAQISAQRETALSEQEQLQYHERPEAFWDAFYAKNQENFFKDRKWLQMEFPEIFDSKVKTEDLNGCPCPLIRIAEVGCGAGNTLFPIVQTNPEAFVYGFDYSKTAIDVVKKHPDYDETKCKAFVYGMRFKNVISNMWKTNKFFCADISQPDKLLDDIPAESIDIVICIFVLSALHPDTWSTAVENINKILRPGGRVLLRDYARYDLTQVRFKKRRMLQDNFYIRGDGTRVYFFTNEELEKMFEGFEVEQNVTDRRLLVNRAKKLTMFRMWVQAKFRKPEGK